MPVTQDPQQQQLAFDFEPGFDTAEDENELDGEGRFEFADDPEFYNTGDYPALNLTVDDIPPEHRRRVLRLRPGVIPTIACALSNIVRAAHHAVSSVVSPAAAPASAAAPPPAPAPPEPAPGPSQTPQDTSLPEPAIVYDGADDTPNITLSQRDFLDFFSALRHAFVGLPDRWRHFLELANEFVTNRADAPDEPPDLQPQPAA
ncbi:MAG: hypothetical protein IT168_13150 [Bryobacterales bacterium]|nr:hypothetical protein [Bryobacterales bacterium]